MIKKSLFLGYFTLVFILCAMSLVQAKQQTTFVLLAKLPAPADRLPASADIDVTYIERTPRYYRYCVTYENGTPYLSPGTENQKRWPDIGEAVTYRAYVMAKKNASGVLDSRPAYFDFQWLVNGGVVSAGQSSVSPIRETTLDYQTVWSIFPLSIEFKITPHDSVIGDISVNNSLKIGSKDLTLSIWTERGIYDIFNNTRNLVGTYSFEDWIKAQFAKMNERFAQAIYPQAFYINENGIDAQLAKINKGTAQGIDDVIYELVPAEGIKDRVRIDKIIVSEQLDSGCTPPSPMDNDENEFLIDGRWQFRDGDCFNNNGMRGDWQNYVNNYVHTIDWGLIHELAHQLGVIDLYRLNLKNVEPASPNAGVHIKGLDGEEIPYTRLNGPIFPYPGRMGGGDRFPYPDDTYFESHTAGGLNSNYGHRRGFYGEYLYDTPTYTSLKLLDKRGLPIANAQVKLYQKDPNSEEVDDYPEIISTTNNAGVVDLPNRPVNGVTTATGHTLRPNPFGHINVVGTNGTMIIQVIKDNKEGYGFFTIHDLNLAYYSGFKEVSTVTVKTNFDIDFTPPVISRIASFGITSNSAIIIWDTNEPADSTARYCIRTNDEITICWYSASSNMVTNHIVRLTDLIPNTTYYFRVRSTDSAGNFAESAEHVFNTAPAKNASQFISQAVPTNMVAGQSYRVQVRMLNTSGTKWDETAAYRLGSQNPQENLTWGVRKVIISSPAAPREIAIFNFAVKAPKMPGIYNFQWRMVQEGKEWFGQYTPNLAITVATPSLPQHRWYIRPWIRR